jgi:hypothetical protein
MSPAGIKTAAAFRQSLQLKNLRRAHLSKTMDVPAVATAFGEASNRHNLILYWLHV